MNHRMTSIATALLLVCSSARYTSAFVAPNHSSHAHRSTPSIQEIHTATSSFNVVVSTNKLGRISNRSHTNSCKQTELGAALLPPGKLAAIGIGVAKFYKASPLVAGFLTASTKACLADSMAQYRDVCTTKFDFKRNIAMVLYSGTVLGMLCAIMYNHIFPVIFAGETRPIILAVKMTLFDGFINAPLIWLPPAYIAQALIYQYPKREAIQKYVTDVKENGLLKKYWSLWLPASLTNFMFVPAHFRVAFVAGVSFFWMIILSLVANKGDQDVDSCPVEPEPRLLAPRAMD
mmetsp:Transcript_36953/g.75327  ORF Transcript_36953/g.75327 Transcript_36953/m.75327 type:complete len:290 (-) Transcript_36953:135-1004(-)